MHEHRKSFSDILIVLSFLGVVFAFGGAFFSDLWLAPTQWLIVAATLGIWAVYARLRNED